MLVSFGGESGERDIGEDAFGGELAVGLARGLALRAGGGGMFGAEFAGGSGSRRGFGAGVFPEDHGGGEQEEEDGEEAGFHGIRKRGSWAGIRAQEHAGHGTPET